MLRSEGFFRLLIHHVSRNSLSPIWWIFTGYCIWPWTESLINNDFHYIFTLTGCDLGDGMAENDEECFGYHSSAFIRLLILRHPSLHIQTESGVLLCVYCQSLRDLQILLGFLFTSFSWPIIREFKEREYIRILHHRPDAHLLPERQPGVLILYLISWLISSPGECLLHWSMLLRCWSVTFTDWWMTAGRGSCLLHWKSDCLRRIVEETSTFIQSINQWLIWLTSYSSFCSTNHFLNV